MLFVAHRDNLVFFLVVEYENITRCLSILLWMDICPSVSGWELLGVKAALNVLTWYTTKCGIESVGRCVVNVIISCW